MSWLLRTMELFVAFFIVVTGTILMPQVSNNSTWWFTLIYSLSILFSSVYFIWNGISKRFVKDKVSVPQKLVQNDKQGVKK